MRGNSTTGGIPGAPPPSVARPGPSPVQIEVSPTCRRTLEATARAATSPQRDVQRARIILLCAEGHPNRTVAQQLGCDEDTVGKWRRRFHEQHLKGLWDSPRSGRPSKFSAEQKVRVLQKATESPAQNGVPFSHWDSVALSRLAVDAGIAESIHPSTVWRWLDEADLQPHRTRYWLQSPDADFEVRMRDVTQVYLSAIERAKKGIAIFCLDEKTSIQAKQRKRPDLPMQAGIPQRIEHEYIRHGTRCLTAGFNVATGEVQGILTPDRPAPVFAGFVETLCGSVEQAPQIHLVMDQLNTHWHHDLCAVVARLSGVSYDPKQHQKGPQRRAFLMQADKRVVVHFTPKHASWLNQIEIWFSLLGRKLVNRESFASLQDLQEKILRFIRYYNQRLAHPYRWTYTGTPCRA